MSRLGRAPSPGSLKKVDRGGGPQWVLDYRDGRGRRQRVALGPDKRVAERRRIALIQQRDMELSGLGAVEGQSMPLVELRDAYLADLRVRVGAKEVRSRTDSLARVLDAVPGTRVRDVRVLDVLAYQRDRLADGVSNRTVNVDTGALSAMLTWGVTAQLIAENPLRSLKPLPTSERHQRRVRRALSDDEIVRFLNAAAEDDAECAARAAAERTINSHSRGAKYAARLRRERVPQATLWRALLDTGARWGELTAVTWLDLDVDRLALTLRAANTKSGRTRVIPISAELANELLVLRELHQRTRMRLVQPGDRVFVSPDGSDWAEYTTNARRLLRRVLDRAGIARIDALGRVIDIHALRHTAATRMARRSVPLVVAQRVLGHSSPELTAKVYTHLELDDLRVVVADGAAERRRAAW